MTRAPNTGWPALELRLWTSPGNGCPSWLGSFWCSTKRRDNNSWDRVGSIRPSLNQCGMLVATDHPGTPKIVIVRFTALTSGQRLKAPRNLNKTDIIRVLIVFAVRLEEAGLPGKSKRAAVVTLGQNIPL